MGIAAALAIVIAGHPLAVEPTPRTIGVTGDAE